MIGESLAPDRNAFIDRMIEKELAKNGRRIEEGQQADTPPLLEYAGRTEETGSVHGESRATAKNEGAQRTTESKVISGEETLKESGELLSIAEIKRLLPKKIMHQTLITILDYLQRSGKIIIGTKGILWIYAEKKELDELIKMGTEI